MRSAIPSRHAELIVRAARAVDRELGDQLELHGKAVVDHPMRVSMTEQLLNELSNLGLGNGNSPNSYGLEIENLIDLLKPGDDEPVEIELSGWR